MRKLFLLAIAIYFLQNIHSTTPKYGIDHVYEINHDTIETEEIIYETDTVVLPADTIKIIDTIKTEKVLTKKNNPKKLPSKSVLYTELHGSLWAFSTSIIKDNEHYSNNLLSNQQILFCIGKQKNNWKYYLRFSQSRYSENTKVKTTKELSDTTIFGDSIYIRALKVTNTTLIKNYYLYSYAGAGITTQVELFRNKLFTLHPSAFGGVFLPWEAKSYIQRKEDIYLEQIQALPSIQVGMSCGLYTKLSPHMKFVILPEYSHIFVFYNNKPYTNRDIFNFHLGILVSY